MNTKTTFFFHRLAKRTTKTAACFSLAAMTALGQSPDAAAEGRKSHDEFVAAEQAVQKKQASSDSFQRELDQLVEQKNTLQRELINSKSKSAFAAEKLKYYSTLGNQTEIEHWNGQVQNWEARIKGSGVEIAKIDSDIQATVQALQTSLKQSDESALLLPGESIEVFVAEDDTLNSVYQIRRGGHIIMPRVGRIELAGKDLAGAEKAIKEALSQSQIKDATVVVERPSGTASMSDGAVVYLAGEFKKPGAWKIPVGLSPTLITTILRSGGLNESADLTRVRLMRLVSGEAQVEEVNVQAIMHGAGLQSDLTVGSGDIVMVPSYAAVVYVTGNVLKPGAMKLLPDDELTAYSAVLRAGGFARFANKNKVYVLRDMGNGAKKKIHVSIKDIQGGKGTDVILQSKDIVVVPERFFSF